MRLELFGTLVSQGPDRVAVLVRVVGFRGWPRLAEVGQPEAVPAVNQHVGGFDAAMDDADLMGVVKGVGGLDGPTHDPVAMPPCRCLPRAGR